ncbi:hypothetical protein AHF37_05129 [Paragonimus kellicotti]|nr:hypothetical protein AHF37_05129 [Paragonimus kellicotti]
MRLIRQSHMQFHNTNDNSNRCFARNILRSRAMHETLWIWGISIFPSPFEVIQFVVLISNCSYSIHDSRNVYHPATTRSCYHMMRTKQLLPIVGGIHYSHCLHNYLLFASKQPKTLQLEHNMIIIFQ